MRFDRRFWADFAGAALVAIFAALPIIMSNVMDRGHEIPRVALSQPLALLAFGAILMAGNWWQTAVRTVAALPAMACIVSFLLLAGISSAMSDMFEMAIFGGYYRREGLLVWTSYAAVFATLLGLNRSLEWHVRLLDVMLLTSIVPCSYALLQRVGLDFYHVVGREIARPAGTLGNPLFLAAYLGMLLPLSVVRVWISSPRAMDMAPWIFLGLVQGATLLITQSRGPILAVSAVSLGLLCLIGGQMRSRKMFVLVAVAFSIAVASVAAINTSERLGKLAQATPVISRLVYSPGRDATDETQKASGSAATRLSILRAGNETFADASLLHKLIGFGPDSAYTHYFSHMPDAAMQTEGYWQSNTFDRLHADTLDIVLNFGALGWLAYCSFFFLVFYAAAKALFGQSGVVGPWKYSLFVIASALLCAALAVSTGFHDAAMPAFGLGMGGGWLVFFVVCAWQTLRSEAPITPGDAVVPWKLLAGLTSSLLVFWIDAQINIPVHTTRFFSFGIAAMVLLISTLILKRENAPVESAPAPAWSIPYWGIALALVAACASLFPLAHFDSSLAGMEAGRWRLSGLPVALLMACGAFYHRCTNGSFGLQQPVGRQWILLVVCLPAFYAFCHWLLMAKVGPEVEYGVAGRLVASATLVQVFILVMCIGAACQSSRQQIQVTCTELASGAQKLASVAVFALAMLAAFFAWTAIRADIGSTVASWAAIKQLEVSDRILVATIDAMPHERQYQRQRTFSFLGRAVADIRKHGASPEHFPEIRRNLKLAEKQARESVRLFPADPWIVLALANTLQIRALPIIRPLAPEEGRNAVLEADELFARAYEIFPNQPLLLRNWAQLRFNEGDNWGAYRLLDRMESIIPTYLEPYSERIIMAKQLNDSYAVRDVLARAALKLDRASMDRLSAVAKTQQAPK